MAEQRKAPVPEPPVPVASGTPTLARPGRRERNKQEKLARIVSAARALFQQQGFSDTTTQQIAEAADIGAGTLFLYARSKEDLLVLVFRDEMMETARSAFARVDETAPLLDQLMQVFATMAAYHEQDQTIARILLKEIMFPDAIGRQNDIAELLDVIFAGCAALIEKARQAGRLGPGAAPLQIAENLFANYYLGLLGWLGGRTSSRQFLLRLRQLSAITLGCEA